MSSQGSQAADGASRPQPPHGRPPPGLVAQRPPLPPPPRMPAPASSGLAPIQEQQPAQQPALQPPPPAYGAFPAAPVTSPVSTSHHRAAPPLPPVSSRAAFAGQLPSMAAAPATAPPPVPPKPQTLAAVDASALPARLEAPRVLTMQIDTSWHKEALADEMPAPASPIATISSTDLAELQVDRTTEAAHAFVARTMDERMHEFTRRENLRVYTATWNVNGKLEDQALVTRWLEAGLNDRAADIVAIGLQEMIELSATNVVGSSIVDTQSRERAAAWLDMFRESLRTIGRRSNVDYELVASTQMVGIFLAVFARITLLHSVKDVQMGSAATGAGGLLGNKGGCAIRFQCYDTSVCFVSAHLAAHRNAVAARNDDYATITTKRMFVNSQLPVPAASSKGTGMRAKQIGAASRIIGSPAERHMASASTVGKQGKDEMQQVKARLQALEQEHDVQSVIKAYQYTVLDHDLVFWVGDLNYRIIEEVPMDDVYDMINTGMIEKLTASDQLNIERAAGRVFQEFNEGKLTFAPTYKYIPGQDIYDQRPEKKMRCPAWCDRVLWRILHPWSYETVQLVHYNRSSNMISDHKPVHAVFDVQVRSTDPEREQAVLTEVLQARDEYITNEFGKVVATPNHIWFTNVQVRPADRQHSVREGIVMTNSGRKDAVVAFIAETVPEWLVIEPAVCRVPAGTSVTVNVRVLPAIAVASAVEHFTSALLVCRVENGDDLIFPISCSLSHT